MGWCEQHLESGCVFGYDPELPKEYCPEQSGGTCTLVHIMLTVHNMPQAARRRVIAALYPAYGIQSDSTEAQAPSAAVQTGGREPTTDH